MKSDCVISRCSKQSRRERLARVKPPSHTRNVRVTTATSSKGDSNVDQSCRSQSDVTPSACGGMHSNVAAGRASGNSKVVASSVSSDANGGSSVNGQVDGLAGANKTGYGSNTASSAVRLPYHHQTLSDFCGLVARVFYDDVCVVLVDFLVREQRAFTEADIRERLKWRDNLLHQKLYYLEKQLIVQREQNFERGNKSPVYWRINPLIVPSVQWHLAKLFSDLQRYVEESNFLHEFECPVCRKCYSALDVAAGFRALEDDHALCKLCGERLCPSNSEAAKAQVRDKQARAVAQLAAVKQASTKVSNMHVPIFEKFTRADKNEKKREMESLQGQNDGPSSDAVSNSGAVDPVALSGDRSLMGANAMTPSSSFRGRQSPEGVEGGLVVVGQKRPLVNDPAVTGAGGGMKAVRRDTGSAANNVSLTIMGLSGMQNSSSLQFNNKTRVIPWLEKPAGRSH